MGDTERALVDFQLKFVFENLAHFRTQHAVETPWHSRPTYRKRIARPPRQTKPKAPKPAPKAPKPTPIKVQAVVVPKPNPETAVLEAIDHLLARILTAATRKMLENFRDSRNLPAPDLSIFGFADRQAIDVCRHFLKRNGLQLRPAPESEGKGFKLYVVPRPKISE